MEDELIVCPTCARAHPSSERFCEACGMPLVHTTGAEQETSARQQTARKIKPQYAEGPLVKVARVANQPEAEFIAGDSAAAARGYGGAGWLLLAGQDLSEPLHHRPIHHRHVLEWTPLRRSMLLNRSRAAQERRLWRERSPLRN